MYWAQQLAAQTQDSELAAHFAPLANQLAEQEQQILTELNAVQGKAAPLTGYYYMDPKALEQVMRPSATLNKALAALN